MRDHIDLFSGLGCWAIAAHANGASTVALCEREEWLAKGLETIWRCPCHRDVKTFPAEKYRGAWLLTGSPPCQPASLAGKRKGASDDRWLWRETISVCEIMQPTWFCFENPPGIDGVGLDGIILDLERIGYEVQPIRIPACAVNSPQDRDRFWIMGHTTSERKSSGSDEPKRESEGRVVNGGYVGSPLANGERNRSQTKPPEGHAWIEYPGGTKKESLANLQKHFVRSGLCEEKSRGIGRGRFGESTWEDYEWIEFNGELYRIPTNLHKLANGVADRIPRKVHSKLVGALGNAIVWTIADQIIKAMIQAEV